MIPAIQKKDDRGKHNKFMKSQLQWVGNPKCQQNKADVSLIRSIVTTQFSIIRSIVTTQFFHLLLLQMESKIINQREQKTIILFFPTSSWNWQGKKINMFFCKVTLITLMNLWVLY